MNFNPFKKLLSSAKSLLIDILFPRICLSCSREGTYLCQDCLALLEVSDSQYCLCQKPKKVISSGKCPSCRAKNLSGLYFALSYQNPLVKKIIHYLKYQPYLKELAKNLAYLIIAHFRLLEKPEGKTWKEKILIPIPLTKKRERERGFNQAEEIAKELSLFFNIPLFSNCLIKTKQTLPQVELSEKERVQNIKGVFFVKDKQSIKGREILLIDDVYTTGSTMEEAAEVLKIAGAKEVWGVVVARG